MQEIEHYWEARIELIPTLKEGVISSIIPTIKEEDPLKAKVRTSLEEINGKEATMTLDNTRPILLQMVQALKTTLFVIGKPPSFKFF